MVAAGVVDDDHRVGLVGLGDQPVEHPVEQVGPVVGDDDDGDGLGRLLSHGGTSRCPVKSPRSPASIARAESARRAAVRPREGVEPGRLGHERQRGRPAAVVAQVDQVVAGHAVVLEVARGVVVRRPAERHRSAEVVGGGVQVARGHHRRDAPAGLAGPPEVLDVVAPDEELLAGQPDPLDQLAGDEHAVERDHHVGDHPVAGGRLDLGHPVHDGARPGQPDREAQPRRVVLGEHRRAPEVVVVLEQDRSGSRVPGTPSSSISHTRSAPRSIARPGRRGSRPLPRGCRVQEERRQRDAVRGRGLAAATRRCRPSRRCRRRGSRDARGSRAAGRPVAAPGPAG